MSYVDEVIQLVVEKNPAEPEFHQAVKEVLESLRVVVEANEEKFRREALLERIIKACSNVGDTVLDPFSGSGTTCYVAKRLNRKYIGIEKEKEYFNISKRRIDSI